MMMRNWKSNANKFRGSETVTKSSQRICKKYRTWKRRNKKDLMRNYQKLIVKNKRKKMPKCSSTVTPFRRADNPISLWNYKQYQIQWTLSVLTTLYLKLLSISKENLGQLRVFVSLSRTYFCLRVHLHSK